HHVQSKRARRRRRLSDDVHLWWRRRCGRRWIAEQESAAAAEQLSRQSAADSARRSGRHRTARLRYSERQPLCLGHIYERRREREIWAYGFRNPHRLAFDAPSGNLIVNDIGLNSYEEVDIVHK